MHTCKPPVDFGENMARALKAKELGQDRMGAGCKRVSDARFETASFLYSNLKIPIFKFENPDFQN